MEDLRKKIDAVILDADCDLSIIIKNHDEDYFIYECNGNKQLVSASLIKVPILLAILEKVKEKNISLDDKIIVKKEVVLEDTKVFSIDNDEIYTILELLNWMIIISDNTATNVLIDKFGIDTINTYIKNKLNLENTLLQRKMLDYVAIENGYQNYTSQHDMLSIFTKLFNKEILTDDLCDLAIDILSRQKCQDQVMGNIDEDIFYAHKTGSLDYLNHDVGVMNINNNLFYIGISVYNCKEKNGNKKIVGKLGKMIFDNIKNENRI